MNSPSLSARIAAVSHQLGPTESTVARTLGDHLGELAELSTTQVAELAGASRASVVRTCQSLGYTGYQQLRVLAARDAARDAAGDRPTVGAADGSVIGTMRSLAIQVGSATELLEEAQLDATVADLRRAHRVLVVAGGLSASVGSALTARLLRAGITTLMPTDPLDVELVAATLDPGDVCIAVSASGAHAGTLHTARTAQAQGARVIALSAFAQTPLEQFADRTHVTPVPDRHFRDELHTPSRLALHALVEALSTVMDAAADIGSHERLLEVVSSHVDE